MIKITNKADFLVVDLKKESLDWYDPIPVDGADGIYFVGTIIPLTAAAYLESPTRKIAIYEPTPNLAGEYKAFWYDSYLKFSM